MKNSIFRKSILLTLSIILLSILKVKAQDFGGNFAIGINTASALYSEKDGPTVGGRLIATIPGISISKYLGKKITISATFSKSINDTQQYFSSDFNLSYDIFNPEGKLRPYLLGGLGIVNLLDSGFTLNLGAGGTYWISKRIGLNGHLMYKLSVLGSEFQRSHVFGSIGIAYSFNIGGSKRLWE